MKKLWFRRLLLTVFLSVALAVFLSQVSSSSTSTFYWSPNVHFGLPAHNTEVAFNDWISLDSFEWDVHNQSATQITFTNIQMDADAVSSLTVETQASNITFTALDLDEWVSYTVEGTGAQHIEIEEPTFVYIDDVTYSKGTKWMYSGGWITVSGATSSVDFYYETIVWPYPNPPIVANKSWYMRSDIQTVNEVTGYVLRDEASSTSTYATAQVAGNETVYYGYKVWLLRSNGETTQLTTTQIYSWRTTNGDGTQNILWTPPEKDLQVGYDAIKIVLYVKFGSGAWQSLATFVSDRLMYKTLQATEWGFSTYTNRTYSGGNTVAYVFWGDDTYVTSISNIQFVTPDPYDMMNYKLQSGDIIGFLIYPYFNLIGNLFYGIVMLIICTPIYFRNRSLTPILILFIIFGGATGIFSLLVPEAGFKIAWVFFLIGLAGLLYKVFR